MKVVKKNIYVADFETTVYDGQQKTEVWSCCVCRIFEDIPLIFGNILDGMQYFEREAKTKNIIVYFHNLKFDGNFIMYYLLSHSEKYKQGIRYEFSEDGKAIPVFKKDKELQNGEYTYLISNKMVQWYSLKLKINDHIIEFRDSLKLLPFSLADIGKSFDTRHKKLEMDYNNHFAPNCEITEEERRYIVNDVLCLKEAIEIMVNQNHLKLTIGACCMNEFKNIAFDPFLTYDRMFPQLDEIKTPLEDFETAYEYIHKSYRGGWVYVNPKKANKVIKKGLTGDVNSLYPSAMHSDSGNAYPIGVPTFWIGNMIPEEAQRKDRYFFVRFKCRFKLKNNHLPFVQVKDSYIYRSTDMLTTSDFYDRKSKKYTRYYREKETGKVKDTFVTMTMTCTDYKRFLEYYKVYDFEILDGCWFYTMKGIFDSYINKYKKIKMNSTGAIRTLAKLYLNNLYGKLATGKDSSYKIAYLDDETKSVQFETVAENKKRCGYIACGSAVTSYARDFEIRSAQANYDSFVYADTDSIHCEGDVIKGIRIHDSDFNAWKIENRWIDGYFVRAKTYIEYCTHKDEKKCEPYFNVKCAGMPDRCKNLFIASMTHKKEDIEKLGKIDDNEKKFISKKRCIYDFNVGLKVPSKLFQKRIEGGVLLVKGDYEMHERY